MSYTLRKYADNKKSQVRYFILDNDGGNDNNIGYVDAALGATIVPTGLALKTFEQLFLNLAINGNGRRCIILVKNRAAGATYLEKDGVTLADVDFSGVSGYESISLKGSTDLTNSATDRIIAGAIQGQVGPGGGGVWTCAAGATTGVFSVSAGALNAEPAIIGMRGRFTGNITPALTNVCFNIQANTATQITVGNALGTAPAAGDTFTIEIPGVRINSLNFNINTPSGLSIDAEVAISSLVGIATVNTAVQTFLISGNGAIQVSFCEGLGTSNVTQIIIQNIFQLTIAKTYTDESATSRNLGFGLRCRGDYLFSNIITCNLTEFAHISTTATAGAVRYFCIGYGVLCRGGSYFGVRTLFFQCGFSESHPSSAALVIGAGRQAALVVLRAIGGIIIGLTKAFTAGIDCTQCGASAGITINNPSNQFNTYIDRVSGSAGNTGVGIDLFGSSNARIFLGSSVANTVTGTAGDINLPSNVKSTHAAFTVVSLVDSNTNLVSGSGGIQNQDVSIALTNNTGATLAVGDLVRQSSSSQVANAQADIAANSTGPLLVALTPTINGALGYFGSLAGVVTRKLNFDAAPTVLAIAYVSVTTARNATTTIPPLAATNQKRRLGLVLSVSGTVGVVTNSVDNLPVIADGLA